MTGLLTADPADVLRCALELDDAAEEAWSAAQAARRAESAGWRGPAQRSFDAHLAAVRTDLDAVSRGYGDAAEVLQRYARQLQEAQATARRAHELASNAAGPIAGPPSTAQVEHREAFSLAAQRMVREAEQQERAAALAAASALRDVAARAPQAGRFAAGGRFVDDVAGAVRDSAVGLIALWATGASALPLVNGARRQREARRELLATATQSVQVWQPFVDAYRSAVDGRWGQSVGGLAGVIAFRKGRRIHHVDPRRANRGQDRHAEAVLRRIAEGDAATGRMRSARERVDLLAAEAAGGHTLLEHVGRPAEYLAWRAHRNGAAATTFPDERAAERAVEQALRVRAREVDEFMASAVPPRRVLTVDTGNIVGSGCLPGQLAVRRTRVVRVVLDRVDGGGFVITSAFPLL